MHLAHLFFVFVCLNIDMTSESLLSRLAASRVIKSDRVLKVMKKVDRAAYVPKGLDPYEDRPQPIGDGQTISAPHMHGQALELLCPFLHPGCKALDIGCGSGYLTACMGELVAPGGLVIGIENRQSLVDLALSNVSRDQPTLLKQGIVEIKFGDGWTGAGFKDHLFDAIHVGAAAETVPDQLLRSLKPGGRMVIPVGPQWGSQTFLQIDKDKSGCVTQTELMSVMYVPLEKEPGTPSRLLFRDL